MQPDPIWVKFGRLVLSATVRIQDLTPEQHEVLFARDDRLAIVGHGLQSPFHTIEPGVILGKDGNVMYDRPVVHEKPSVMVVVWGYDDEGDVRLGLIRQGRPPADDPNDSTNPNGVVVFAQVVMGYYSDGDTLKEAALRERLEESGKCTVLGFEELDFPKWNIEPNTWATYHTVAFVQVDLSTVDLAHHVGDEFIKGTVYLKVKDVLRYITVGRDETDAIYRGGSTLAPLMMFFAKHPEHFPAL